MVDITIVFMGFINHVITGSMGDLQDPTDGGTNLVPYVRPYELRGYSLKFFRPEK